MLFRIRDILVTCLHPKSPGRDRQALGTRTPQVLGGRKGGRPGSEIAMLSAEEGSEYRPPSLYETSSATIGSPLRLADENASGAGEVSEHGDGLASDQHGWT